MSTCFLASWSSTESTLIRSMLQSEAFEPVRISERPLSRTLDYPFWDRDIISYTPRNAFWQGEGMGSGYITKFKDASLWKSDCRNNYLAAICSHNTQVPHYSLNTILQRYAISIHFVEDFLSHNPSPSWASPEAVDVTPSQFGKLKLHHEIRLGILLFIRFTISAI